MSIAKPKSEHQAIKVEAAAACYHCGEGCPDAGIRIDDKVFCCEGCKTVYEILNDNGLCRYYEIDENAGISLKGQAKAEYAYLDDPDVHERLVDFSDGRRTKITFYLPQIHCASCIWLLESLYKLSDGILDSKVNFLKKEIFINFDEEATSLRKIVELLASIGYAPSINLSDLDKEERPPIDRSFFYKLGVAGFAFGNIMLLSFPEYLGLDKTVDQRFFQLFGYLNILLALPLVFYSARGYLQSAWLGLRQGTLNIDVPISLGILTLFGRSVFEILTHSGAGYLDSLAGLVFFLLIGKWFQQRTYHNISFERDYKSYFPIAARMKTPEGETTVPLDKLEPGDVILVKNRELVPADSVLLRGDGQIDYSFVTGESEPVDCKEGEKIYAGGRQTGGAIEVSLTRKVSQSYLTQLWNDEAFTKKHESRAGRLADRVGKYFTVAILLIAFGTLAYWLPRDMHTAVNAFTAVLIIACPCAVALAIPFIFGNALRILGRHEFYLKNTNVIEGLNEFTHTVFDKTGTLTQRRESQVEFVGQPLNLEEKQAALALTAASNHPASQEISRYLSHQINETTEESPPVKDWKEVPGRGIQGSIGDRKIRIGSDAFMEAALPNEYSEDDGVYLQIGPDIRGFFRIDHLFRPGTTDVMNYFRQRGSVFLLSGDNDRERPLLEPVFGAGGHLLFRQSPRDKLAFIKDLQTAGQPVLMLGDGLNDAGALQQSDVGIVLAEDTNNFTPACDAILHAGRFHHLPRFIDFARRSIRLVFGAFGFAFVYNVIGLSFAVQGALSPIVAAILMPLSSISIVLFGMGMSNWVARRMGLNN
jgi:Cu+-exporting ATPase